MKINQEILAQRIAAYDRITGPRVGDFLRLPRLDPRSAEFTRFTHDWGDRIQTGGISGSFYLSEGSISYSGGLNPGVATADLVATSETREGQIWFFDLNQSGAGRGVYFIMPFRIFDIRSGADTHGLYEMGTGYHLCYRAEPAAGDYPWSISKSGMAHTAFHHLVELEQWLDRENLALSRDPHQSQRILWPA